MVYTAVVQVLDDIDLLTEILVRVPAKPLITFKTVSKFWSTLISDRKFQIAHTRHHPPSILSGFYYQNYKWSVDIRPISFLGSPSSIPKIASLESGRQRSPTKSTEIKILDSCNGLILCHNVKKKAYSVLNPTTGNYRLLPEPLSPCRPLSPWSVNDRPFCFLAFDPSKSDHFKVVHLKYTESYDVTIDIFSSENESCKRVSFQVPGNWNFDDTRVVFWNGALNWISKEKLHIRFIVKEEKFTSVDICREGMVAYFGECGHSLHLVKFRVVGARHLKVFEMNKDSNSWVLKLRLSLEPLVSVFREMGPPSIQGRLSYSVLSVRRETNKDNFSFVLGISGKIIDHWMNKDANLTMTTVLGKFEDFLSLQSYIDLHPFIQCLAPV